MALQHFIKHIYNNGTDEVIRRAKKINKQGFVEMTSHDEFIGNINFRVKDDRYGSYNKVNLKKYADEKLMTLKCSCPNSQGNICRHEAASLFKLQDMIDKNLLLSTTIQYDQHHTVVKMKHIDLKMMSVLSSASIYEEAENILATYPITINKADDERVEASMEIEADFFPVVIQKNQERYFDTSCSCAESMHPLCKHKIAVYLFLHDEYDANYFDSIRNWDKQKNILLGIYGYSLEDDLDGKFEFKYKDGKPFLSLLDTSIKRVSAPAVRRPVAEPVAKQSKPLAFVDTVPKRSTSSAVVDVAEQEEMHLGIVINFNTDQYPWFTLDAILGEAEEDHTKFITAAKKLDLTKFVDVSSLSEEDVILFQQIRKLQPSEITKFLDKTSPFSGMWENIVQAEGEDLPEDTRLLIAQYVVPKLSAIFEEQVLNNLIYFLPPGKTFKSKNLVPVEVSDKFIIPQFEVAVAKSDMHISCNVVLPMSTEDLTENKSPSPIFYLHDSIMYLWQDAEDAIVAERYMQKKSLIIKQKDWEVGLRDHIMPLLSSYKVDFDKKLIKVEKGIDPIIKVMLKEKGDYLVFQPIFSYNGHDTITADKDKITLPNGNKLLIIHRNKEIEEEFIKKISSLHSAFIKQEDTGSLVLKGTDALSNNWFFLFIDAMKDLKIPIFGFEALRNYRFNTARPNTQIHVTSGLDWFDAKVEIEFGDQKVGIPEIKKALATRQTFVQLGDGSLGILPEEWLQKYSLLFKVGDGQGGKLRLSKYHMSVIDELYENRNEEELSFELDEKYERLRSFNEIPDTEAPEEVAPILRPYQLAGFQWLHYLQEVGWGGILADDMGLGKTIQALTTLKNYKNEHGKLLALVVCPTTLIYNWQHEVQKFTPDLTHHIHHGSGRIRKPEILQQSDVIITTYGTLRSDITLLLKLNFDYAILDESQSIKNPNSKVTKAATLLQAKNKVCMSGTPLQNNTFDIFAQMNFLNPGLLGTVEFFRNEFATPIDKLGEEAPKIHLRKLLLPFILRRTKEQVAKDLPDKTETILFCEMEKEQRKIYDAYRNSYRDKIMGTIDDQGINKSQLTILQGLMKLRQICDSPAILNEEDSYPNHSIKLKELARELAENMSDHKALVFSQFLGMLALIKEELKKQNIPFEYFDGSTSSRDRQTAMENFQKDDDCRVFLISLKAGGVGLNLTAADYVYLVDPWWNPAVEQQAIDRTHRIGQTKNIFAYRMICKDTIEDKILTLQDRKKVLAKELISDESGFVKSLTKEDVEYLFS